ncbi:ring-cleaving dioxygenase [Sporosarcina pasteurii]|uniref:Ring-cleaving dioxygenase mhqO n=1 Tax=Sporosarcina pasteurii TaxID=1474 RepID=A0A380CIQ3_SPOPA|nr:ring-cleaving dioxygenase [Sporosarcina pasteurii]MDS9472153.1 ring-cleaving dioxygenase [Sporosarcina pasteurii]QBQ07196.1 ring-cleaving dioxygenase [Sporosarcina pasteurii]SUJ20344.1 Putative ring-cleaving dioxygenase mhqO [Sporosarcina pasteurii]
MKLAGIHHVSAITADIEKNHDFFTRVLGMRLVKKTVNQDSTSSYHLFYADAEGTPGTDMTYFDIPMAGRTYPGVSSISNTAFRVMSDDALTFWKQRFEKLGVMHEEIMERFGRKTMKFQDDEGSRLMLVVDDGKGVPYGVPWKKEDIPIDYAIVGLGPVTLTVRKPESTAKVLVDVLRFEEVGSYPSTIEGMPEIRVFSTGEGGPAAEVHVETRTDLPFERPGRGSVHHIAFRVKTMEEYKKWEEHLRNNGFKTSGLIDRYYFKAIYFREPNGILYELSTDEPGFTNDEPLDKLGESLALPPFLEPKRDSIEASLRPIHTN